MLEERERLCATIPNLEIERNSLFDERTRNRSVICDLNSK